MAMASTTAALLLVFFLKSNSYFYLLSVVADIVDEAVRRSTLGIFDLR